MSQISNDTYDDSSESDNADNTLNRMKYRTATANFGDVKIERDEASILQKRRAMLEEKKEVLMTTFAGKKGQIPLFYT